MKTLTASLLSGAAHYWSDFGIPTVVIDDKLVGTLPPGVIAFFASGEEQVERQRKVLQAIGIVPALSFSPSKKAYTYLYALSSETSFEEVKQKLCHATTVLGEGDEIRLPSGPMIKKSDWPSDVNGLSEFYLPDSEGTSDDLPQQVVDGTVLDQYSLLDVDLGDVVHSCPLLGEAILKGQATVMYAAPGTGKTLLALHLVIEASKQGIVQPSKTYVVNADDSGEGVQVKKDILAEYGVHMLVPGLQGFDTDKLTTSMKQMIDRNECRDILILVDTLKKFADLMEKKKAAEFGDVARRFVLKGGTFVALAHTRKNEGTDGQLVYAGTTDIVEDFDAACLLVPLKEREANGEKLVQFQFLKRRGPNAEETYAYEDDPEQDYLEKLDSVRLVQNAELRAQVTYQQYRDDEYLIGAIRRVIGSGIQQKMALVKQVSERTNASRQDVLDVLDRYTGKDPAHDQWTFTVGAKGAKLYEAHPEREEVEEQASGRIPGS